LGETVTRSEGRQPREQVSRLVDLGVIVAVSVLQPSNHLRPVLHFQICLKDLDMHLLAFSRAGAGGAGIVEGQVAIMRFEKLRYGSGGSHLELNVEGAVEPRLYHESLSRRLKCNSKVRGRLD